MSDLLKSDEINFAGHRLLFASGVVTDLVQKNLTMWPYVLFEGVKEVQVIPNVNDTPKNIEYNLVMGSKKSDFNKNCNFLLNMIDQILGHKEYHLIVKVNKKVEFSTVPNVTTRKQSAKRPRATKRSRKKT